MYTLNDQLYLLSKDERHRLARNHEYNLVVTIRRVFGFGIDINYNKSPYENAIEVILLEPKNIFRCNKTNSAFHNLFPSDIELPAGTKSLLGLGLKFCIKRGRPYQDICTALRLFKRSVDLRKWLLDNDVEPNDEFNKRLYVPSEFIPDPCDKELAEAFDRFECFVNKLRNNLPTYRRFNLKPLLRKAMSALRTMSFAIGHPRDKGLAPYMAY